MIRFVSGAGRNWERTALLLLFLAVCFLFVKQDWLWRWDSLLYDAALSLLPQDVPEDIVIVAIDDASLAELGRWPWSRRVHAQLLNQLKRQGARVTGMDIVFAEPDRVDPEGDLELAAALRDNGRVVLPVALEELRARGQLFELLPVAPLAEHAVALGHVHVELDQDGIARSVFLREGLGQPRWPGLALAMLQVADGEQWQELPGMRAPDDTVDDPSVWARDNLVLLPFVGPPGSIPRISYVQALTGEHLPELLRDKFVLVGATATGIGDYLPTPVSGNNRPMPGVEFNANVLHALRENRILTPAPELTQLILSMALVALPFLIYPRLRPVLGFASAAVMVCGTLLLSHATLVALRIWFAPAVPLLLIALSYPIWSWLRLESAFRYLGQETRRIQQKGGTVPVAPNTDAMLRFLEVMLPLHNAECVYSPVVERSLQASRSIGSEPWSLRGNRLSLTLASADEAFSVTGTWRAADAPTAAQRRFLNDITRVERSAAAADRRHSEEVVAAQIEQLQQANRELDALRGVVDEGLAKMTDGVVVVGALGEIRISNPQAGLYLFGDGGHDLVGMSLLNLLRDNSPQIETDITAALRAALIEQTSATVRARYLNRDLVMQFAPLSISSSHLGALIINVSDMTEFHRRERERSELLSFLSHDLRSPLMSVLALLDSVRRKEVGHAELDRTLTHIDDYTNKTLSLAQQFLELVRAESPEHVTFDEIDLVEIATNAVDQLWSQANARHIRLVREHDLDEGWSLGEATLLERAIVNLVNNAIKYSPEQSVVTVTVSRLNDLLLCAVADQGHGIDSQDVAHLFDRFQRLRQTGDSPQAGTGLGLALVKAVAELHGGRVEVETSSGRGTTFKLFIPVRPIPDLSDRT